MTTRCRSFLDRVLDALRARGRAISVGVDGEPDPEVVLDLADAVEASPDEVRMALIGLRVHYCLVEDVLEIDGAESVTLWTVHPQCQGSVGP